MDSPLQLHALDAKLRDHGVDAVLLDGAQAVARHAQLDPTLLVFQPETLLVQIGQEAAALPVVGVRDAVSHHRSLASHFAYARHGIFLSGRRKKGVLYTSCRA